MKIINNDYKDITINKIIFHNSSNWYVVGFEGFIFLLNNIDITRKNYII